ncbi:P2-like prophage tail protein X [Thalassovita litoralis]|uniref:P2-like prophage tail protein X n=1 Tax=Thalassovita litoralis TaxID=1010611 RepID=A0A521D1D2_9RHOB|nr:tail protein X [Thalassovita litoralis]SMO65503.1 P2-like prophage tail protein X [Thalassovita litoralis]
MTTMTETVTVEGDSLTVSLIVWRRFHRQMPRLVEEIYYINPGLAEYGQTLPVGVTFEMPIPIPRAQQVLDPITLW